VSAARWTEELLDSLRQQGDPPADEVVAAYFADLGDRAEAEPHDPGRLFRRLALGPPPGVASDDADSHVQAYLRTMPGRPAWLDPDLVAAGQERFARWGPHVFTALYAGALPTAYACWKGVEVLGLTARLVTDTRRRLNETAQFHLDVMTPGGLEPGARGWTDARHVRLMHAAVRWLIERDPRARWDPALGVPLNQEDLFETLLTFTEVAFEVFEKTGVDFTDDDANAYLHTWSLIGYLLGVRADLLPLNRAETRALMPIVRRRQFGPSASGRLLTAALLDQGRRLAPPGLRGLPATTVRYCVGDATADLLGVPNADWTRALFGPLSSLTRVLSAERAHRRLLRRFSDRVGLGLLRLAVDAERSGGRAPFAVPTALADRWGVTPRAAPVGAARRAARRAGPG
jgi:hypothetical protein